MMGLCKSVCHIVMMLVMMVNLIAGKYYERQSGWVMGSRTSHGVVGGQE